MTTVFDSPARLDLVEKGLYDAFTESLGGDLVSWGNFEPSRGQLPSRYVSLRVISPFSPESLPNPKTRKTASEIDSIDIKFLSPTANERNTFRLNGVSYVNTNGGTETPETVRDTFLALVVGDTLVTSTAVAISTDKIRLTPSVSGGLWELNLRGEMVVDAKTETGNILSIATVLDIGLLEISCFSQDTSLQNGAQNLSSKCSSSLRSPAFAENLWHNGISILGVDKPQGLDAISGREWETRTSQTVTLGILSTVVEIDTPVTSITITPDLKNLLGDTEHSEPLTIALP